MPYKDPAEQARYVNEWLKRRRLEWVNRNGPCQLCGSSEDLQVDHLDPSKKITHRVWGWRAERREAELAKCRVLCDGCHRAKSAREAAKGERKVASAKLTECEVREIRTLADSRTRRSLAIRYGVSKSQIQKIIKRERWAHVA